MVLLKTTIVGAGMVLVALLLLTLLGPYVTIEAQQVQRRDLEPHAEFLVGDVVDRQYTIPSAVSVFGQVAVTQAPTNQSGEVHFVVLDSDNYEKMSTGGSADSLFSADSPGQFNYTFTAPKAGVYHFMFDNRASVYKEYVVLTVSYNEVFANKIPDTRVQYVGWILFAVGGLILALGLIRKPPITWS